MRLKSSIEFADLISSGKLFQRFGAATEKARSPSPPGISTNRVLEAHAQNNFALIATACCKQQVLQKNLL